MCALGLAPQTLLFDVSERVFCPFPLQILYYDGQFNDARLNVTLATSAAAAGAAVSNYTECKGLIKV